MIAPVQCLTSQEQAIVHAALMRWWNDHTEDRLDMVGRLQTMTGIAARVTRELRADQFGWPKDGNPNLPS